MKRIYRVLFVDDEAQILTAIRRGLADEDYECVFANSGEEALKIMAVHEIAVIVSDMKMPVMDGLTLLKEVRSKYPKTVKIVLSGFAQLQQVLTTVNQADIFRFITKPWKMEGDFKDSILKGIEYYRLQIEREEFEQELLVKNKSYQNILKRVDDVIAGAKLRSEIMRYLGHSVFETIFTELNHEKSLAGIKESTSILAHLFDIFANQNVGEFEDSNVEEIVQSITKSLIGVSGVEDVEVENKVVKNTRFKSNLSIFQALVISATSTFIEGARVSIKTIYHEEEKGNAKRLTLSMVISSGQEGKEEQGEEIQIQNMQHKIQLFNIIVAGAIERMQGSYYCRGFDTKIIQKFVLKSSE